MIVKSLVLFAMLLMTHGNESINEGVIPHYQKFIDIANQCQVTYREDQPIRIEMSDLTGVFALCNRPINLIKVNRTAWSKLSIDKQEQLIFHELGHCLLNQNHNDQGLNIMNTLGWIDLHLYQEYYDYFIRRLFKGCQVPLDQQFKY